MHPHPHHWLCMCECVHGKFVILTKRTKITHTVVTADTMHKRYSYNVLQKVKRYFVQLYLGGLKLH